METIQEIKRHLSTLWTGVCRVVKTRIFAAAVMGAFTVVLAVGVATNSRAVTVTDGDESRVVLTLHSDPYRVLTTAGVTLKAYDALYVDSQADTIDVARAMAVEIQADGMSTLLHLTEGTVEDALRQADVSVGKYDSLNVKKDAPIEEGMCIKVDRVAYEEYTVNETVDYEINTKYTPVLRPGVTRVIASGQEGRKTITYRKTIVNGKAVETEKVGEKVTKKPVTKQVLKGSSYGTPLSKAPHGIKLDSHGQPVHFKKKFSGSCTAYATGTIGASGMRLGVGTVAVNPRKIPYGSKLWITSADGKFVYGYAIAADTGGFANGNRTICDLYFGSYDEACYFGRRNLNIYVLD